MLASAGLLGALGGGAAVAALDAADGSGLPGPVPVTTSERATPPTTCVIPPAAPAAPATDTDPGAVVVTFVVPDCG